MLPRDEFKERLALVVTLSIQEAEKRRMRFFRLGTFVERRLKEFLLEMQSQGFLECPWLERPPLISELTGLLILSQDLDGTKVNIGPLMVQLYPPELAHRFPVAAGKTRPKPPPTGGGRFVDTDD